MTAVLIHLRVRGMAVTVEVLIGHALFGQRILAPLRVEVVLVPEKQKHG